MPTAAKIKSWTMIALLPVMSGAVVFWWLSSERTEADGEIAAYQLPPHHEEVLSSDETGGSASPDEPVDEAMSAYTAQDEAASKAAPYNLLDEMLGEGGTRYGLSSADEIENARRSPTYLTHAQVSTDPYFEDQASIRDEYVSFEMPLSTVALMMESEGAELPMTIDYQLFDGVRVGFVVKKHLRQGVLSGVMVGEVEGHVGSFAVMAYNDLAEVGTLSIPGKGEFRVTYAGEGVHRISEMNLAAIPPCGTPES